MFATGWRRNCDNSETFHPERFCLPPDPAATINHYKSEKRPFREGISPPRIQRDVKQKMDRKARIFLVCSVPFIRRGLTSFIEACPNLTLCGVAGNIGEAFQTFPKSAVDLLILDPASSQNVDLALARQTWPHLPILVFTPLDESRHALTCFRAGAKGYVMAGPDMDELAQAIRRILNGGRYVGPRLSEILLDQALRSDDQHSPRLTPQLTQRERDVLGAISRGLTTRQIAAHLRLSGKTIETHRQNLKSKLRLRNSQELVEFARQP
jgi:DNA-binding NarL/FixJ family response regulator